VESRGASKKVAPMITCQRRETFEDRLVCCLFHATERAQARADAEYYNYVVWWVMRHDAYLVEPEGITPVFRCVTKEATVKPA
jgi:hypothetical protein